jgi:hypothetical protein
MASRLTMTKHCVSVGAVIAGRKPRLPLASILVYGALLPVVAAVTFLATGFVIIAIRGN